MSQVRPPADWLLGRESDVYSQFGEDGLIAATLERIGTLNCCCFEVGANDGRFYSNTRRLFECGWRTLLIEGDRSFGPNLQTLTEEFPAVQFVLEKIDRNSLDRLLDAAGMPVDLDLGVIDIDGQDYWAWEGMWKFRPRVLLVEFANPNAGLPDFIPDETTGTGQAGVNAIHALGERKGYTLLADTFVNALFARNDTLA